MLKTLQAQLDFFPNKNTVWVGLSGGLDSTVLLQSLCRLRMESFFDLKAIHVHHHLNPFAEEWVIACEKMCRALDVPLTVLHLDLNDKKGESPEAHARTHRYQACSALLNPNDLFLTAHHQEDQLETYLLQLMRGAGPKGLSGIAEKMPFGKGYLLRPFLAIERTTLLQAALDQKLTWIEDPSNADTRFDRNFLRHQVIPLLKSRWAKVAATVSRTAAHCHEADLLITEKCGQYLERVALENNIFECLNPAFRPLFFKVGFFKQTLPTEAPHLLSLKALLTFSIPWQKEILRHWILTEGFLCPSTQKLEQVLKTVIHARHDRMPCVTWKGASLKRHQDYLYLLTPKPIEKPFLEKGICLNWNDEDPLPITGTEIVLTKSLFEKQGLDFKKHTGPFVVRARAGEERCRLPNKSHSVSIKQVFQACKIPPWVREKLLLLCTKDEVIGILW